MSETKHILIGNTFPLTLIRGKVEITPVAIQAWWNALGKIKANGYNFEIKSFWGHSNTIKVASDFLGKDVTPKTERPALSLKNDKIVFDGIEFNEIFVLSPDYIGTYRPAIGEEVSADRISGWQLLVVRFV